MLLAGRPDADFHISTQGCEKFHQAPNRKIARSVPHQQRNLRLLHAKNFGDLCLCHAAVLENRIDLQRELGLKQLLLRTGKPKVSKYVSTAFGYSGNSTASLFGFPFHFSSAFLDSRVRPQRAAV